MDNKLLGLLGLARRAGKITFGNDAVIKDTAEGKAAVILLSCDISPRTRRNIERIGGDYKVDIVELPYTKELIGQAIGKNNTAVAAITDRSFANRIAELCRVNEREEDLHDDKIQGS